MSHDEIIGTSRVLLVAGAETTATLLSGATYHLLRNPTVLHRVQSEVRAAFKTADEITLGAVRTTRSLPYLEATIQESMRCCPPVPATLPRITGPGGAVIDGKFVPQNVCDNCRPMYSHHFCSHLQTSVGVHQWSTYRSSANFASPDTFDPERWLPEAPTKYRSDIKAALQPFSLGPRGCIGKR